MSAAHSWRRCGKDAPCPMCGKEQWCGISGDGSAAICMRIESGKPTRNGGWLHVLVQKDTPPPSQRYRLPASLCPPAFGALAEQLQRQMTHGNLTTLARCLGVTSSALIRIGCGRNGPANSFPMTNSHGRIVGIRYRHSHTGSQWSERGGKEGLFVPSGVTTGSPLLLPEGPTDTAALLSIGDLSVIGRPSCSGGTRHCIEYARHRDVVVCADADGAGRRGADRLATALMAVAKSVRVIEPPAGHKDFRDAIRAGLDAAGLGDQINGAVPRRFYVRVRR